MLLFNFETIYWNRTIKLLILYVILVLFVIALILLFIELFGNKNNYLRRNQNKSVVKNVINPNKSLELKPQPTLENKETVKVSIMKNKVSEHINLVTIEDSQYVIVSMLKPKINNKERLTIKEESKRSRRINGINN